MLPSVPRCPSCGLQPGPEAVVCPADGTSLAGVLQRDPLVGATVGEYLIEARVGSGGMGIVYRARQPLISKKVAIKVLRPEVASNPLEVERILAEARTVNAVGHRGIIDIFGCGTVPDGRQYLAMEYLEGAPLDRLIAEGAPMPHTEVLSILDELLDALSAVHAAGVVHRDLKPSNVFLVTPRAGSPFVKILDFGLAKQSTAPGGEVMQTHPSVVCGTPEFMAPEQARGMPVSPRTDLYAVGCFTYEMLTGSLPFTAPSAVELMMAHIDRPVVPPSSTHPAVPPSLDAFLLRLLAKDPDGRPADAGVAREELRRLLPGLGGRKVLRPQVPSEGAAQTRNAPVPQGENAPVRHAVRWGWGMAAALLLLTAAAYLRWMQREEPTAPAPVVAAPAPAPPPAPSSEPSPTQPEAVTPTAAELEPAVEPPGLAETHSEPAPPRPLRPRAGKLQLDIRGWGDVYIDGERRGRVPPHNRFVLEAGAHQLEIRQGELSHRARIVIRAGKTHLERVELR